MDEMNGVDILDIKKKVVRDSLLSKMTYYEYIGFNIGLWMVSKFVGGCPAVNGAAFALKREVFESLSGFRSVISEDLDIAVRAFLRGYTFRYTKRVEVYNHVHADWRDWFVQRQRWVIGAADWFKEWYRDLLRETIKKLQVFLPVLLFVFPALVLSISNMSLPDLYLYKSLQVILLFLAAKFSLLLPVLMVASLGIITLKSILSTALGFLVVGVCFFALSKKLGFEFKIHEFFVYYFTTRFCVC